MPFNYKTYADLARDVAAGVARLPETDLVVGIPKSGIIPAAMIAAHLNRELMDVDSFQFVNAARSGFRRPHPTPGTRDTTGMGPLRVLVVDDSVHTGRQLTETRARLAAMERVAQFTFLAVYGTGSGVHPQADIVLSHVPVPRMFEWNYRNHIIAEHALFDLDGVLCRDPDESQNDDGDAYRRFLAEATPLTVPTREISAIVTSRLEKYRPETEAWLAANGIRYAELLMLDLPSAAERRRLKAHAPFKADIYAARPETLFVESNWRQAQEIAERADKPVICTENDVLLYGAEHLRDLRTRGLVMDRETPALLDELRRQNRDLTRTLGRDRKGRRAFGTLRQVAAAVFAARRDHRP